MLKRLLYFFVIFYSFFSCENAFTEEKAFIAANQTEIIKISEEIKQNEIVLAETKIYIEKFKAKKNKLSDYIARSSNNVAIYLIAIYKLKKIPPELILLKKTSTFEMAKINVITQSSLNFLIHEIKNTIEKMDELEQIQKEININYAKLNTINNKLKNMDVVINSIFNTEQENIKLINQQKKLKQISMNSKNIAEFINTLIKKNNSKKINKEANLMVENSKNKFVFPNTGVIATKFKVDKNYFFSFGITILSQENSIVVSPFDGIVLFADSFKEMGSMVVIQHSDSYTSIIMGDFDIKVKPTQLVKTNEIIAKNKNKIGNIYFEIQKDGKPINPVSFMKK